MTKSKELKVVDEQTFLNELRLKALESLLRLIDKNDFRATKFVLESLDKSFRPAYSVLADAKSLTLNQTTIHKEIKIMVIDGEEIEI